MLRRCTRCAQRAHGGPQLRNLLGGTAARLDLMGGAPVDQAAPEHDSLPDPDVAHVGALLGSAAAASSGSRPRAEHPFSTTSTGAAVTPRMRSSVSIATSRSTMAGRTGTITMSATAVAALVAASLPAHRGGVSRSTT